MRKNTRSDIMSILLKDSKTKDNLMRSFAGESQARNRYLFSASKAQKDNLYVISQVFNYTADQERAHAKVFYNFLKELSGKSIEVDGKYPIDLYDTTLELLRAAQHNEYEEYEHEYATFGKIAREEGFITIANTFEMIAKIEKTHGDRFGRFADMLEQDKLFKSDTEVEWICLNCGHIHKGLSAPLLCPACKHNQGFFMLKTLSPYEGQ